MMMTPFFYIMILVIGVCVICVIMGFRPHARETYINNENMNDDKFNIVNDNIKRLESQLYDVNSQVQSVNIIDDQINLKVSTIQDQAKQQDNKYQYDLNDIRSKLDLYDKYLDDITKSATKYTDTVVYETVQETKRKESKLLQSIDDVIQNKDTNLRNFTESETRNAKMYADIQLQGLRTKTDQEFKNTKIYSDIQLQGLKTNTDQEFKNVKHYVDTEILSINLKEKTDTTTIQAMINDIRNTIKTEIDKITKKQDSDITNFNTNILQLKQLISTIQTDLDKLKITTTKTLPDLIKTNANGISKNTIDINKTTTDINNLNKLLNDTILKENTSFTSLNTQVTANKQFINNLQDKMQTKTDLAVFNNTNTNVNNLINYINTVVKSQSQSLSDLHNTMQSKTNSVDFNNTNANFNTNLNNLKNVVITQNQSISDLENTITSLSATNHQAQPVLKISTNGRCGSQYGNTMCGGNTCCSDYGWCGGNKSKGHDAWCAYGNHGADGGKWDGQ